MFLGSIILLITTVFPIFILIFTCKHINSLSNQGKNLFDKLNIVSFCFLLSLIGMITCVIAYREYEEIAIAANNLCFWGAVIIYLVEFKKYIKEQRQLGSRFYNNGGKTIITFMVVLLCLMVTCLMDLLIPQLVNSAISNGSIEQNLKGLSYLLENPDIENTVKSLVGISVILLIALSFFTYKLYKSIKAEEIPDNSRITTVSVIGTVIILIDTFLITTYFNISGESEKVSFFAAINLLLGIGLIWYLYPKFKKALNECFGANIPESSPTQTVQSENKQVQVKSRTDMLLELKAVLDAGVLTQEEFNEQKKTILKTISENDKPTVDRLTDVKKLFEAGIYSQEEMETEKNKILGKSTPVSIQPATKPIEPSKPTTFCPVCGGVIEEGTTVCPYCDEMISDEAKTCPYCGEMISDEAKTCPYCGENVEEFFSALYKEKEAKAAKDIQTAAKDTSSKEQIRVGMKKTPILYSLIIPLATLLIVSIGLLVFHVNYEYTDYWVEEESIILPIAGIAIIGLIIYYSILYKAKFGDIIKKLKNPNVIGISCFAILVIIVVSYVFITAKNDDNFAKPKSEAQIEDNRSASEDDDDWDTVAVEAADPDEAVEEEISNDLSSKEASVKKWVEKVYANVFSNRKGLRKGTIKCDYFSEELNMWIETIEEYDREHHQGEYGFFTEDIWTKSQDPSDNISASVKSVRFETDYMDNEYAEVVVCISDYGNNETVYLRLYPDGDSWIIGDYDGMLGKMKSYHAQRL